MKSILLVVHKYIINCLFSLMLLLMAMPGMAKQITKSESLKIAQQFYHEQCGSKGTNLKSATTFDFKLDYISTDTDTKLKSGSLPTISNDSTAYYYIYNVGNNQGFVIVSGDTRTTPILGYSNEGKFDHSTMPEQVQEFMNNYKVQVRLLMQSNDTVSFKSTLARQSTKTVAPLIKTKWGQSSPYNNKVPKNYATGCVATSMAQVMNYHKWPKQGFGSYGYDNPPRDIIGSYIPEFNANFGITNYDWDNMLNDYSSVYDTSSVSCKAVGTLMYHCGVAANMSYGYFLSTAFPFCIPSALKDNFGYDKNVKFVPHNEISDSDWKNLIISELDANRPVILGGSIEVGGHSFVGDGYDENRLIHINWGWRGTDDGYFEVSTLISTPNNISFNEEQTMIIGIKKPEKVSDYSLFYTNLTVDSGYNTPILKDTKIGGSFNSIESNGKLFMGKVGIALYRNNTLHSVIDSTLININESTNRQDVQQWVAKKINMKFNDSISSGTYQLKPVYKSQTDLNWAPSIYYSGDQNLEVEITDSQLMFFQNSKTIKCKAAGELATYITNDDRIRLKRIVVSGTIDAVDIQNMRDRLRNIDIIDIKNINIVKSICVSGTYEEQGLFTSAFMKNPLRHIELPTNLKTLGAAAFSHCIRLETISIPSIIRSIKLESFYRCNNLNSISLPDSLRVLGKRAFVDCINLQSIELPAMVDSIYKYAFWNCTGLKDFFSYNSIPPIVLDSAFFSIPINLPIHVPIGCKPIYQSANGWKIFTNIIADLPAKVNKTVYNPIAGKLSTHFSKGERITINNLTITGNLNITDFAFIRDTLLAVKNLDISEVKLPDNKIPDQAFYKSSYNSKMQLVKIVLPKYLVAIGDYAFINCSNLKNISFPNYLTKIGIGAFDGCYSIANYELDYGGSNFKIIDGVVFNANNTSLILYPAGKEDKTYIVGYSINTIGNSAFSECSKLEEVKLDDNITSIGDYAFKGCKSLIKIDLPEKISTIGDAAYYGCTGITKIISNNPIPPVIGGKLTFYGVPKDINVQVPVGKVELYKGASGWKEFTNINDDLVTKTVLNNIAGKLSTHFTPYEISTVNKLIITGDLNSSDFLFIKNYLIKLAEIDISGTVLTKIPSYAFNSIKKLVSVKLPNGIISIGEYAFDWCSGLTSITLPLSVTTIERNAFSSCIGVTSLILPASLVSIGSSAFSFIGLKTIKVNNVVPINLSASLSVFEGVNKNTCILIVPVGSKSAYQNAAQWKDFKGIVEGENYPTTKTIIVSAGRLSTSLTSTEFITINNLTVIGVMDARDFVFLRDSMPNLAILDLSGVDIAAYTGTQGTNFSNNTTYPAKEIPESAFFSYFNLFTNKETSFTSITLPSSITSIGKMAFQSCSLPGILTIPPSVISIGSNAFSNCKKLISIIIPKSVTQIADQAFGSCSGLISVNVDNPNYSSIDGVLFNKTQTKLLYCPISKAGIYTIPESVKSIGNYSFGGCIGLTSIVIPSNVNLIEGNAFYGCINLASIYAKVATPVNLSSSINVFYNVNQTSCTLQVPKGSKTAYQKANQWKDFTNIVEMEDAVLSVSMITSTNGTFSFNIAANVPNTTLQVDWGDGTMVNYTVGTGWIEINSNKDLKENTTIAIYGTGISYLDVIGKSLIDLNVSNCTSLIGLYCYNNKLTTLNVSKNVGLTQLSCNQNILTNLDVSKNIDLQELYFSENQISSLDVKQNSKLISLVCWTNQLAVLDVSNNTNLKLLGCENNKLNVLDVSKNLLLTEFYCGGNQLNNLDISKNIALNGFNCYSNKLTSLDVSKNIALEKLGCYDNPLSILDVSKNVALTELRCQLNKLTSLDVSKNASMSILTCQSNQLNTLDVSRNTELTFFSCRDNKLKELNVTKNTKLTELYCYGNSFNFANLPQVKTQYVKYTYAPQSLFSIPKAIEKGKTIDLSTQLNANDITLQQQTTICTWKTNTGNVLTEGNDYSVPEPGKFVFLTIPTDSVFCEMSNRAFPDFKDTDIYKTTLTKISLPTGINEPEIAENIRIYASGKMVYVRFPENPKNARIAIYDMTGRLIVTEIAEDELTAIPISRSGIYMIRADEGGRIQTGKVIIQ